MYNSSIIKILSAEILDFLLNNNFQSDFTNDIRKVDVQRSARVKWFSD